MIEQWDHGQIPFTDKLPGRVQSLAAIDQQRRQSDSRRPAAPVGGIVVAIDRRSTEGV
jgi:hypothetical protein